MGGFTSRLLWLVPRLHRRKISEAGGLRQSIRDTGESWCLKAFWTQGMVGSSAHTAEWAHDHYCQAYAAIYLITTVDSIPYLWTRGNREGMKFRFISRLASSHSMGVHTASSFLGSITQTARRLHSRLGNDLWLTGVNSGKTVVFHEMGDKTSFLNLEAIELLLVYGKLSTSRMWRKCNIF